MNEADLNGRLDRYVAFWGEKGLHRYPICELRQFGLPDHATRFLVDLGLPKTTSGPFRAATDLELLTDLRSDGRFLVIAQDCSTPVCSDAGNDGEVVELDEYGTEIKYVMGSDVVRFALLLTEYEQSLRKGVGLSNEQQLLLTESMERAMRAIDSAAMDDPKGGWPVLIGDIRQSLM